MPNEPYRQSEGSSDTGELARLAEEGQRRIHAASAGRSQDARVEANRHLRVAVGSVRGSAFKRALLALIVLGSLTAIAGIALTFLGTLTAISDPGRQAAMWVPLIPVGTLIGVAALMAYLFVAPVASRAQMDAEHAWISSMPFALEGHFETLSAVPEGFARLKIELTWQTVGVDLPTLQGIVGLLDTEGRVTGAREGVTIETGQISGFTGIRVNRVSIYRNHGVAKYLHRLVDVVLLPVHRNRALARVRVTRT